MSHLLFHWAPTSRRKGIERLGLVPGSWSRDRVWKPPYVCFSGSPSLAWALSGAIGQTEAITSWDLWQVWSDRLDGYEVLVFDDDPDEVKEFRVYHRIYKRDIWYVATRVLAPQEALP